MEDWQRLLADLDAQLIAADRLEFEAEVADRARREAAAILFADRLRGVVGDRALLRLNGGHVVQGEVEAVGPDWLIVREGPAPGAVVVLHAVVQARVGPSGARPSEGVVAARFSVAMVLRRLASEAAVVRAFLTEGGVVSGRLVDVGADYLELREIDADQTPVLLPLTALALVRPLP